MIALPLTLLLASAAPPSSNQRECYGCIGWCTYGDASCFADKTYGKTPPALAWHDADADLGLQGRGWPSGAMPADGKYTRLPAKAKAIVDPTVWSLAQMSAGLKSRFSTTAKDV